MLNLLCLIILTKTTTATTANDIHFSGFDWQVRDTGSSTEGPGPNYWSPQNVWLDNNGALHLKISRINGNWTCAEIYSDAKMGFGTYEMKITGRLNQMDPNVCFAMFNYPDEDVGPDGTNQLDVEFSRWGYPDANVGSYVVFPAKFPNNGPISAPFQQPVDSDTSMHGYKWMPDRVMFTSTRGLDDKSPTMSNWTYAPGNYREMVPQKPMRMHFNLYLSKGVPYSNSVGDSALEIVVNEFTFIPINATTTEVEPTAKTGLILGLCIGLGLVVLLVAVACLSFRLMCCQGLRRRREVGRTNKMIKARRKDDGFAGIPFNSFPSNFACDEELQKYVSRYEIPLARVLISDVLLGKGEYGVVFKAGLISLEKNADVLTVAVKTVVEDDKESLQDFLGEIKLMTKVGQHLNIVNLIGVVVKGKPLLILEYCALGSLRKFLRAQRSDIGAQHPRASIDSNDPVEFDGFDSKMQRSAKLKEITDPLTTEDLCGFGYQIARGMEYLSSRNIIHRDLAARNCLVCENLVIKICDFGLAREREVDYNMGSRQAMPLKWMAPESIQSKVFSQKSDVWSFGVTLWEIFGYGGNPYSREDGLSSAREFLALLESGYRLKTPDGAPNEIAKVMDDCWSLKPNDRPSFVELRIKFASFVREDYYLKLDATHKDYNRYIDIELESKPEERRSNITAN